MKLRYLIPFYILLASVTFCGRKIADDNDANKAPKDVTTNPSLITGTLELDKKTDSIYADIWMRVPNADYKTVDNMVLETGESFKGVSFMYYDAVNNAPDNGNDTIPMHVVFSFKNDKNWQVNDSIRVMSLNEEDQTTFRELKNYFELRMDFFRNTPTSYPELVTFNERWNIDHSSNPVYTVPRTHSGVDSPRVTRDDNILSLKSR